MNRDRGGIFRIKDHFTYDGIQSIMMFTFAGLSVLIVIVLAIVFVMGFRSSAENEYISNAQVIVDETGRNLENHLLNLRHVSDTVSYNILSENDVTQPQLEREIYLLYEANQSTIRSIALYNGSGSLLMSEPTANQKEDPDVTKQEWFYGAMREMENLYFSTPHVQDLFQDEAGKYHWVISMSRTIDITSGTSQATGVLLVDMNYSDVERTMEQINDSDNGAYYYLCDDTGNMIFHPYMAGFELNKRSEPTIKTAVSHGDGVHTVMAGGRLLHVVVRTIAYTGWKMVAVVPDSAIMKGSGASIWTILFFFTMVLMLALIVNRLAAKRISKPILELNESVKNLEASDMTAGADIYIGGPSEIRHLGSTIQNSYEEIRRLMAEVVREERERRKNEMDALQSQINPHFLYNTLDSITWMIEGDRNEDASYMITQLARLLRISLSKGRTIIPLRDEISHARSYMNIQKYRYKDSFSVDYQLPEDYGNLCTVKLVIQPVLENAIYYGMEGMVDGDGEIMVKAEKRGDDLYISVTDNGCGMDEETVEGLLTDENRVHKHGSGVGLLNVHNRIRLMFGDDYGLIIESEPDEGTCVTIHIPAIEYDEDTRKRLEGGSGL
ncbi:MAG: sensor histidine kinase [Lachnospiraceae bacterium]|nr:sensor histidine kinase [Lachnospiraceae bacterium]